MSWIQENKFTAALAGVTAVGSIALISLSMGKSDEFEESKSQLKAALREEADIQSIQPYPNSENVEGKKLVVSDYEKGADSLRRQFAAYRPSSKEIEDFSPDKFSAIVSSYRSRLDSKFNKNGVELPDRCIYGFEAYARKFPRPEVTGELSYQIKAMEWLFTKLAKNKPEALLNVVRAKFSLENEPERSLKSNVKPKELAYYVMPLEVSFRADEESASNFLSEIANTDKYAFVIRSLRVQNERSTPPTSKDGKFESTTPGESDDAMFDFDLSSGVGVGDAVVEVVGGQPEPEVPTVGSDNETQRKLLPILGGEKVNVFLKLDLILLNKSAVQPLEKVEENTEVKNSSPAS